MAILPEQAAARAKQAVQKVKGAAVGIAKRAAKAGAKAGYAAKPVAMKKGGTVKPKSKKAK